MDAILSTPVQTERPKLQPWIHTDFGSGIPYYDEELGLMQGDAHKEAVTKYGPCFDFVASKLGLKYLSDQPIWFYEPKEKKQVGRAGDLVLAERVDVKRITVDSVLFYTEIVSTDDPRREKKDILQKKPLCEYNGVPEFGLYFPDLDDERVFELYRLVNGKYYPILENEYGMFRSEIIDGLCIERLTKDEWKDGQKIRVWFAGEALHDLSWEINKRKELELGKEILEERWGATEIARMEEQKRREQAEIEKAEEQKRREQAEMKSLALAEKLRSLGIDPDNL